MDVFLTLVLMFVSVLLILVILLQRGRGGGLVGALSGLGGQSAFGTKAGDTFTRITIVIAAIWVVLAGISGQVYRSNTDKAGNFEKADLKTDIQATTTDGKSSPSIKKDAAGDESSGANEAGQSASVTDEKQGQEKLPTESNEESTKKDSPKADKDGKAETPSETPKESEKKEAETKSGDGEKKKADGTAKETK